MHSLLSINQSIKMI